MKKLKAYFAQWFHSCNPTACPWNNKHGFVSGNYRITEPWFRIGKCQIWHTIKIACLCGKVFYDIENL
jgi:hypothetical protein